ncbi:hypothetical protein M406DRAFT_264147, partial [Cryphonectria parasitica EP155]
LPSELIDHILSYLSPVDLTSVSHADRTLYAHARADHLWQRIVQSNVPGVKLTTPYPCASFRELYAAHDPHWFLTKNKVWFGDGNFAGKMIIARYDERRGVIEAHQLLGNNILSPSAANSPSLMDGDVQVHHFDPQLHLHLDKPVLRIDADGKEAAARANSSNTPPTSLPRYSEETHMSLDDKVPVSSFDTFMLARALPAPEAEELGRQPFPHGNVWPPPAIPASERVTAAPIMGGLADSMSQEHRPTQRSEISETSFRIRSWMEARPPGMPMENRVSSHPFGGASDTSRPWLPSYLYGGRPPPVARIGERVTTFSTLEPELYTPTADQPWKGIWVGDFGSHGCEFLLIKQNHPSPFDEAAFDATRVESETDVEFAERKTDARRYRGSLEAVKLTGDVNVPRGECSIFVDDLGEAGFVTTVEEQPFTGARVVRSKGHIARPGFLNDRYIESQLILISENRIAQFWVHFNQISFFERVDVDKFLGPN